MEIGIYHETDGTCLYTADVSFSTDTLIVLSCSGMDAGKLEDFLLSRIRCPEGYGADAMMAKRLRLSGREYEFGHLREDAPVLYAMLGHFRVPEDDLGIYPLKNEALSMISSDIRFSNLYTWRKFVS
jgi:hypothetical protein